MENVIVLLLLLLLSPGVPCRPLPLGSDEQDLGRKTRGGISPRGLGEGVSPLIGDARSVVINTQNPRVLRCFALAQVTLLLPRLQRLR